MLPRKVSFDSTRKDPSSWIAKPPLPAVFSENTVLLIAHAPELKRAPPSRTANGVVTPHKKDIALKYNTSSSNYAVEIDA